MPKPELLAPVQDFTSLKAAIDAGADSIYFGIKELNMRIGAKNFELKDTNKVISICHKNKLKAYFTLNTIIYDNELDKIRKILKKLKKERIDAVIAWDFSVIKECEKLKLPVHLSTQASISNFEALKAIKKKFKNIESVNLARELSLPQIKGIIKKIKQDKLNLNIETFIHGAMCVSVSGRCFLSQEIFGKSANRGECLQPCRRKYLIKDLEEDHEFELGDDYIISPRDLCTLPVIGKLAKAGISIFKIEGRNRSPEYVSTVTQVYRQAIDNRKADKTKLLSRLKTVYHRGFSTGFYLGKPVNEWSKAYGSKAAKRKVYLGKVLNFYKKPSVAKVRLETRGIKLNDEIMFQGNKTGVLQQKAASIEVSRRRIAKAAKGRVIGIKTKAAVRQNDKVYLISPSV